MAVLRKRKGGLLIKIKKGLIAAAGRGTRFLPVVKGYPKELVPVLGKPNIQYLVEELIGAGIDEIAIVHRHGNQQLKRYFTPDSELEEYLKKTGKENLLDSLRLIWKKAKICFIPQSRRLPYGNASPILAAKGFIGSDNFVYLYGDDLILEEKTGVYLKHLIEIFVKYQPEVVAAAVKVPLNLVSRLSSVKYRKDRKYPHRVEMVVEKPSLKQTYSNVSLIGRFIVSSKIFSVLAKQKIARGELWFTNAVNTLAGQGVVIAKPISKGEWLTTGDPLRWLKANIKFGLKDKDMSQELKKFLRSIV